MTIENLNFIDKAISLHHVPFDLHMVARNLLNKQETFLPKDILMLLHKSHFSAYIINPQREHPYPTVFWKEDKVIGYQIPGDPKVYLDLQEEESLSKGEFLELHAPEIAMCIPPMEEGNADSEGFFKHILSKRKSVYLELIVLGLFINLFIVCTPLFTLSVYDKVLPTFATSTLWSLTIGILIIFALDWLFKLHRARVIARARMLTSVEQEDTLVTHFLKQRNIFVSVGEETEFMHAVRGARETFITQILPGLADAPFVFLFLGIIALLSPVLVWVPITLILLILFVQAIIIPKHIAQARKSVQEEKKSERLAYDILQANVSIRLMNAGSYVMSLWRMNAYKLQEVVSRTYLFQQIGQTTVVTLSQLSAVGILVFGVFQVHLGHLSVGALIACSILSSRAISPAVNFVDVIVKLQKVRAVAKQYDAIKSESIEYWTQNKNAPEKLINPDCRVQLKNVVATYKGAPKPALDQINLTINPGERVAILGRSGAGKSTLINLISGLNIAQSGQVLVDGVDVRRLPTTELREYVYHLSQSPNFFSGTIRKIIAGESYVDDARVKESAVRSGLMHLLEQSGLGLDSEMGEGALNLSGGGRQVLALAQAFYRTPKLLLMDEPTSHLDNQLEIHVAKQLNAFLDETKSSFVLVTHRMKLLSLVNRIIVVDAGRIVLDGPRDDVLKKIGGGDA